MQTSSGPVDEILTATIPCNRDLDLRRNSRAAILEKINSTESCPRSLYTQLNALAPVSLLPTELLARIFHLHRNGRDYHINARIPLSSTVSHVCRHWREVALGDSSVGCDSEHCPTVQPEMAHRDARSLEERTSGYTASCA
ncbi:hypothetical protein BC834DRAFT_671035 [Gloeopeniophorella convolvens]|nr:hypothetical protein BC834DRAFT_671035 [Gloeopeniophorella convolvens]